MAAAPGEQLPPLPQPTHRLLPSIKASGLHGLHVDTVKGRTLRGEALPRELYPPVRGPLRPASGETPFLPPLPLA